MIHPLSEQGRNFYFYNKTKSKYEMKDLSDESDLTELVTKIQQKMSDVRKVMYRPIRIQDFPPFEIDTTLVTQEDWDYLVKMLFD